MATRSPAPIPNVVSAFARRFAFVAIPAKVVRLGSAVGPAQVTHSLRPNTRVPCSRIAVMVSGKSSCIVLEIGVGMRGTIARKAVGSGFVRTCRTVAVAAALVLLPAACTSATTGPRRTITRTAVPRPVATATPAATPRPTDRASTSVAPVHPTRRTVTILGTGDVLIHPPLWQQAHADARARGERGYDFGPMYASIAPDVRSADLAICEMESPLAPPQGPFTGWPQFSSPPQVLTALKQVGYDSCTTASNHSIDEGYDGVKRTLDEIDAAGIEHTGSARSAAEAARPLIVTMPNGVKVAQLAYAFGFNGLDRPAGEPWLANLTDVPTILAAARRAKRAGADIVVLSMHWGVEYNAGATQEQRDEAHWLLASPDIDVILGDHPHVVEPVQRIGRKWVIYSMGNQISRHADPILASREGAMPMFTFTEVRRAHFVVTKARVVPTLMRLTPKLRLIDLPRALADPATDAADRAAYRASLRHVSATLGAMGAERDGLVIG